VYACVLAVNQVKRRTSIMPRAIAAKQKGKSDILRVRKAPEIGIILYSGAKPAVVLGLTDLFEVANGISLEQGDGSRAELMISHWGVHEGSDCPVREYESHPGKHGKPDCVIFPPTLEIDSDSERTRKLLRWAKAEHASGSTLCSVCGGTFLLAQLGLLNGRPATTHWSYAHLLAARFPQIRVESDDLIIDLGDVVTAGGMMAWVDLGLKLVERYLGPFVMIKTAQFFLVDPAARQQRFYANFSPSLQHGDAAILRVQISIEASPSEPISIAEMAAAAKLGERTFLRRFQKATGMTPTQYVQSVRVQKARELLELTTLPVKEIAWKVSYEDVGAFRKVFQKAVGLQPVEYRKRFGVQKTIPNPQVPVRSYPVIAGKSASRQRPSADDMSILPVAVGSGRAV
jgi:transcriptional regulator GlxA family with amidase domain